MVVQMSWLSDSNCRFGNRFFAYFFLKIAESEVGCEIRYPKWLGSTLFNLPLTQPPVPPDKDINFELQISRENGPEAEIRELAEYQVKGISILEASGTFQYHTSTCLKYKEIFFDAFRFNNHIEQQVNHALENLGLAHRQVVCVHLRRGDYLDFGNNHPLFWRRSFDAVISAISDLTLTAFRNSIIYLSSDDIEYCKKEFEERGISYITNSNLFAELDDSTQLITDFIMMARSNVLIISNSSLSFAAAMLNRNARIFLRPCPKEDRYIPFDPWNSHVLLPQHPFHFK